MSGGVRVFGFALALGALFTAALALGTAFGPFERASASDDEHPHESPVAPDAGAHGDAHAGGSGIGAPAAGHGGGDTTAAPDGLAVAADGLRLAPLRTTLAARRAQTFGFRILDSSGQPVRAFDVEHPRRMHLIVVRRDLTGFQHLHPTLRRDGTWSVPLTLREPGSYRAFADFSTLGRRTVLGVDLNVPGRASPRPLPSPSATARAHGYTVTLAHVHASAGAETTLTFRVTRAGRPVRVGRYLGAAGHLVVLREGDLAYLHTHPEGNRLEFATTFPSTGRYRAFLQFVHGGEVRTAAFTIEVER